MWAIASILLTGGVITWLEAPTMIKKRMIKELVVFFVLLVLGVAACSLHALRVRLPNPLDWITAVHKPMSDLIFGMLQ